MNRYQVSEGEDVINLRRSDLKEIRQTEAADRQAHRDTLTSKQQIAVLDRRLGEGVGAKKERARLAK